MEIYIRTKTSIAIYILPLPTKFDKWISNTQQQHTRRKSNFLFVHFRSGGHTIFSPSVSRNESIEGETMTLTKLRGFAKLVPKLRHLLLAQLNPTACSGKVLS